MSICLRNQYFPVTYLVNTKSCWIPTFLVDKANMNCGWGQNDLIRGKQKDQEGRKARNRGKIACR